MDAISRRNFNLLKIKAQTIPMKYNRFLDLTLIAQKVEVYIEQTNLPKTKMVEDDNGYPQFSTQNHKVKTVKKNKGFPKYTATFIDNRNLREIIFYYNT